MKRKRPATIPTNFGDILQAAKRDNILHVGFQKSRNLPEDCCTSKSQQLVDYVVQKGYNCYMMADIGLNCRKMSANNRWFEQVSGKLENSQSVVAHCVMELHQRQVLQPGGVGLILTDEVTHWITATGKDPTRLGRWCYTCFQGKTLSKRGPLASTGHLICLEQLQPTSNSYNSSNRTTCKMSLTRHFIKTTCTWNVLNRLMRAISLLSVPTQTKTLAPAKWLIFLITLYAGGYS